MMDVRLSDRELRKPIGLDLEGRNVDHAALVERRTPTVHMTTVDIGARKRLVLERNEMEDDFEIERLDGARIDRRQLMREIDDETEVGLWYVDAEISYLTDLQSKIRGEFIESVVPETYTYQVDRPAYEWVPREYRPFILRRSAVFTESNHDGITTSASTFRTANVHSDFTDRGFSIVPLTGASNIRSTFETEMTRPWVCYTSGVGHGGASTYTGNSGALWQVNGYDPSEPAGKVVHLLSCLTAQTLGPDLVSNGANAYFGYHPSFFITWAYPDQFWVCDSAIDYGFAMGMTASEVHDLAMYTFNSMITTMTGIHGPTAVTLTGDRDGLRTPRSGAAYGDTSASIRAFPFIRFMQAEMAKFPLERREREVTTDVRRFMGELLHV